MYIEDILLNYVVPYMPIVSAGSFMQDNASACGTMDTQNLGGSWNCTIWMANLQQKLEPDWTCQGQARQMHLSSCSPGKFTQRIENCLARRKECNITRRDLFMSLDSGSQKQYVLLRSIFGYFHYHLISFDQFGTYTKYAIFYIQEIFFLCIQHV